MKMELFAGTLCAGCRLGQCSRAAASVADTGRFVRLDLGPELCGLLGTSQRDHEPIGDGVEAVVAGCGTSGPPHMKCHLCVAVDLVDALRMGDLLVGVPRLDHDRSAEPRDLDEYARRLRAGKRCERRREFEQIDLAVVVPEGTDHFHHL